MFLWIKWGYGVSAEAECTLEVILNRIFSLTLGKHSFLNILDQLEVGGCVCSVVERHSSYVQFTSPYYA